jgi:hypothetical protein
LNDFDVSAVGKKRQLFLVASQAELSMVDAIEERLFSTGVGNSGLWNRKGF